jgi:hypothetical protein
LKIYVEGGGDSKQLRSLCRRGFSDFFGKAGLFGKMPRVVACGSRENAYDSFCTAVENGESALLLVDSEAPVAAANTPGAVSAWTPWVHLGERKGDGWKRPARAVDEDCHLMVQCMETWFLADPKALEQFFGQGFQAGALPHGSKAVESISKASIFQSLARATRSCKSKRPYGKGEHSFKILGMIDPQKVATASPWAGRLLEELRRR